MELRIYLRMLQRGWWLIALTALAALNIALVASYTTAPTYRATAQFLVTPNTALIPDKRDLVDSLNVLDRPTIVATYAQLLESSRLFRETAIALQRDPDQMVLDYTVAAAVLPDSSVMELSVMGPDPQMVALLVNSIGQRTIDYTNSVYQVYTMSLLNAAQVPEEPISPRPLLNAGVAVLLGLALGSVLAILREQLRQPLDVLLRRSTIDAVSGASNSRFFRRQLEEHIRSQPENLSLGLIQLDGLRDLIEAAPRPIVQDLLRQAADILKRELRGGDIVGRWSEIQFAVLLPSTPGTAAAHVLERIQRALSQPIVLEEGRASLVLAPRIGLTVHQPNEPVRVFIQRTEMALERARQNEASPVYFLEGTQPAPAGYGQPRRQ